MEEAATNDSIFQYWINNLPKTIGMGSRSNSIGLNQLGLRSPSSMLPPRLRPAASGNGSRPGSVGLNQLETVLQSRCWLLGLDLQLHETHCLLKRLSHGHEAKAWLSKYFKWRSRLGSISFVDRHSDCGCTSQKWC